MDHLTNTGSPAAEKVTPAPAIASTDYRAIRESQHKAAIDAGEKLNAAKLANKKMKDIRFLETQHHQAWQRVWAMDAIIRRLES